MTVGWVVLLEASFEGDRDLNLEEVEAVLARFADCYPSALYAPDRCAVQFVVAAAGPADALATGIAMWLDATRGVGLSGCALVRAEVKTPAELAAEYEHSGVASSSVHGPADEQALALAYDANRQLLRVTTPREAVSVLTALVRKLGGAVVPANPGDPRILDLDLSLGDGTPKFPAADPYSVTRLCLEEVLPGVVEDAVRVTELLRAVSTAAAADFKHP